LEAFFYKYFRIVGIIELDHLKARIQIISSIFLYGNAISEEIRKDIEEEVNEMWNAPKTLYWLEGYPWLVEFKSKVFLFPDLRPTEILTNRNPRNNYFRVEEYAYGNISFVDGLGSNTGYFKLENLYRGSTTAAHEYGHTLGLAHPMDLDYRGKGQPSIMYPRGTLVDPEFQYDPSKVAGTAGGTMHPKFRKVFESDVDLLQLERFIQKEESVVGRFSARFHDAHLSNELPPGSMLA